MPRVNFLAHDGVDAELALDRRANPAKRVLGSVAHPADVSPSMPGREGRRERARPAAPAPRI